MNVIAFVIWITSRRQSVDLRSGQSSEGPPRGWSTVTPRRPACMALQTRCISHVAELAGSTCVAVAVPNDADWVADHDQSRTRHGNIRTEASRRCRLRRRRRRCCTLSRLVRLLRYTGPTPEDTDREGRSHQLLRIYPSIESLYDLH